MKTRFWFQVQSCADDRYSSIHIEDFKIDVRDTKLGPEIITRDIPNVGEEKLKDLDENGVSASARRLKPVIFWSAKLLQR
jgi:DNA-directed RNA polymerase beta subunit